MPHPKSIQKQVLDYSKADWEGLCLHLLEVDFSSCYHSLNIKYVWSHIKKAILNSLPMFVPTVRICLKQCPKWITPSLQHQCNCLHSLRRRMIGRQDPTACTRLERAKQHLHEELITAKTAYESKLAQEFAFQTLQKSTNTFIVFQVTALVHPMSGKDLNLLLRQSISFQSIFPLCFYYKLFSLTTAQCVWTMFHLMCQMCFQHLAR